MSFNKKCKCECDAKKFDAMSFNKKCECDAIKVRCALTKSANAMRKSFRTTIPAIYLVPMNLTNLY